MDLLIGTVAGAFRFDGRPHPIVEDTRINHLARGGESWWAADNQGRVHEDGKIIAVMPEGATPLCIQPSRGVVWVGTQGARLFEIERGNIVEDEFFITAPGRGQWFTPWGDPPDIRSLALDADHTLYINVRVGGVLRYDNTGPVATVDIATDVHQVAAHATKKGFIYAASAQGMGASHNGHDFEFFADGLHAKYCRAIAVLETTVIVSASTGPSTSQGRLYRAPIAGGPFQPLTNGLPEWFDGNVNTHCLRGTGNTVFAGFGDTIWQSPDAGENWSELTSGLPQITCLA